MTERRCSHRGCGGVLLEEWGTFRWCPTCREAAADRAEKYRATDAGRAKQNASRQASYRRNAKTENARKDAVRLQRKLAGICKSCTAKAADDSDYCPPHRDQHRASALAWYHRNKPKAAEASPC